MPESFKTEKYEDRSSSKLGVADYFTQHVVWVLLPVIGAAIGLGLRKVIKLPMLEMPGGVLNLLVKKDKTAAIAEANASGSYVRRVSESVGLTIGGMVGAFRLWRGNTKEQMQLDQVAQAATDLRSMESADTYLANENAQLKEQIRFTDRHPSRGARHAETMATKVEIPNETQR